MAISSLHAAGYPYWAHKPDLRSFGAYLGAHMGDGDAIVFATQNDPAHQPNFYFLGTMHYAGPPRGPVFLLDRPADPNLIRQLRAYPRVWLVSDGADPQSVLPGTT